MKIISQAFCTNHALISLDVSSNHVASYGFIDLFTNLQKNKSLVSLDISTRDFLEKNKLTDEAVLSLDKFLAG